VWGDSDTFLFHTVIWAFSVKLFADRSALSICGLISWESPLENVVSALKLGARCSCSPTIRSA